MLTMKDDLKYLKLVRINGLGFWYHRASCEKHMGKKRWTVKITIPWENGDYMFEADESEEYRRKFRYSIIKKPPHFIYSDRKDRVAKDNLFRFVNDVVKLKWLDRNRIRQVV